MRWTLRSPRKENATTLFKVNMSGRGFYSPNLYVQPLKSTHILGTRQFGIHCYFKTITFKTSRKQSNETVYKRYNGPCSQHEKDYGLKIYLLADTNLEIYICVAFKQNNRNNNA